MAIHNNNHNQNNKPQEKKITFENHRLVWRTEVFLRKLLGIKDKEINLKDDYNVQRFLYQLRNIPEKRKLTVIGYGSLMNCTDISRTSPNAENHRLGILNGFERIFNIGGDTSFMNVRRANDTSQMNVSLIDIPFTDIPNLIIREGRYNFEVVDVFDVIENKNISALIVVGDSMFEDDSLSPQLNYLHLCLTGAKWLDGLRGVRDFLETTYCYSNKQHEHIKINDWLKELDLIDYMFVHDYSNR